MNKVLSIKIIEEIESGLGNPKTNYFAFFLKIKKIYKGMDIALICNYILENKKNPKLLSETIKTINSNKYIQNFEALLDFIIKTSDVDLKVLAIKTISTYKNAKAVPVLLTCLNDKKSNYKIRFVAADALGKVGGKNAFDALKDVACDDEEKSAYVKESAVIALGNLGDNRAIDVFSSIMSSKQIFLDKFSYLKERVVEAISKLDVSRNEKALNILKTSIVDSSSRIRISAIETLMNLETPQAYDLIYDRLIYDDDFEVKKNALIALYNLTDRGILDEVIKGDFSFDLRALAQEIIDEFEGEDDE